MRRIGTTIAGIRARHEAQAIRGDINRPGAENVKNAQAVEQEDLYADLSGTSVIASTPATFSVDDSAPTEVCVFAIPNLVFASGVWRAVGVCTDGSVFAADSVIMAGPESVSFPSHTNGIFDQSVAVTAAQLALINAGAGGNVNATYSTPILFNPGGDEDITLFTLSLVTAGGTVYEIFIFGVHPMDGHTDTTVRYIP